MKLLECRDPRSARRTLHSRCKCVVRQAAGVVRSTSPEDTLPLQAVAPACLFTLGGVRLDIPLWPCGLHTRPWEVRQDNSRHLRAKLHTTQANGTGAIFYTREYVPIKLLAIAANSSTAAQIGMLQASFGNVSTAVPLSPPSASGLQGDTSFCFVSWTLTPELVPHPLSSHILLPISCVASCEDGAAEERRNLMASSRCLLVLIVDSRCSEAETCHELGMKYLQSSLLSIQACRSSDVAAVIPVTTAAFVRERERERESPRRPEVGHRCNWSSSSPRPLTIPDCVDDNPRSSVHSYPSPSVWIDWLVAGNTSRQSRLTHVASSQTDGPEIVLPHPAPSTASFHRPKTRSSSYMLFSSRLLYFAPWPRDLISPGASFSSKKLTSPDGCSPGGQYIFQTAFGAATTRLISVNRIPLPAGSPQDFRMQESCRTMPLVGGFSRGSPVYQSLAFRRCSILTSLHPHRGSKPPYLEPPKSLHFKRLLNIATLWGKLSHAGAGLDVKRHQIISHACSMELRSGDLAGQGIMHTPRGARLCCRSDIGTHVILLCDWFLQCDEIWSEARMYNVTYVRRTRHALLNEYQRRPGCIAYGSPYHPRRSSGMASEDTHTCGSNNRVQELFSVTRCRLWRQDAVGTSYHPHSPTLREHSHVTPKHFGNSDICELSTCLCGKVYREWTNGTTGNNRRGTCGVPRAIDVQGERRLQQCVKTNRQAAVEQLTVHMTGCSGTAHSPYDRLQWNSSQSI
ncbi:hypothetical protein PR048_024219 [Dryococelus australis]|uniref:Uncharacterized protein n=1 Tax=Dryococelus australis TaxID=614101 RepID=A0ABQ9GN14_9NEOP|nr:hypothetical protein PR048_024219 [Dryococelus australis]